MVIQIFGTKKCKDTQKAIRFFKERRMQTQFINLREKDMSPGELNNIRRCIPIEELIDIDGKEYEERNLKYLRHDIEDELLDNPLLFKTPIVRSANGATVGHQPEIWKNWAKALKQ
ncbi:MAG: ArsC family transcriptional regulator [candidate division Zixibacteria bacterium]|nr:ArsC family transcriptional regulator [candidate division Zixibacteria bacterium]